MTWATYQGFPCQSVRFRRRRGYRADSTTVTILASDVDVEFKDVKDLVKPSSADTIQLQFDSPLVDEGDLPGTLQPEGVLLLSQENPAGGEPLKIETNLFVARVDLQREYGGGVNRVPDPDATQDEDKPAAVLLLRLLLVDERYFWQRGVSPRWSYNRPLPGFFVAKDSLLVDGTSPTLGRVLSNDVLKHLFRGYEADESSLASGFSKRVEVEFPPWPSAALALSLLSDRAGSVDPCLHFDGKIGLPDPAQPDGVKYAPNGSGPNTSDVPIEALADLDGRGRALMVEPQYPEDYAQVVATGRTIATAAVDDWEPVVMLKGKPFLLSEQLVRALTDGKHGMEWLSRFVMAESSEQAAVDLPDERIEIFRKQAWRLWRLPGAGALGSGPELGGEGFYTDTPGHNAHLLPLLARAETDGGRRLPVQVETYSFDLVRKRFSFDERSRLVAELRSALEAIQVQIALEAQRKGVRCPFTAPPVQEGVTEDEQTIVDVVSGGTQAAAAAAQSVSGFTTIGNLASVFGFSVGDAVQENLRERFVKVISTSELLTQNGSNLDRGALGAAMFLARALLIVNEDINADLGGKWDEAYTRLVEASDGLNGTNEGPYWQLAKQIVALEKRARQEQAGLLADLVQLGTAAGTLKEAFKPYREQAAELVRKAGNEIGNRTESADARRRLGPTRDQALAATALRNKPRTVDEGASVYSAEMGIVRVSRLPGHAKDVQVSRPSLTEFVPGPVRVSFGAVLRPRVDVLPRKSGQPTGITVDKSGVGRAKPPEEKTPTPVEVLRSFLAEIPADEQPVPVLKGGDNKVPWTLDDHATYLAALFKRSGRGLTAEAELLDLRNVTEEQLQQAARLDLLGALLVPLEDPGNARELIDEATDLATRAFRRPREVAGAEVTLIGPWPIQCDGSVASVEIELQENATTFLTRVTLGTSTVTIDPTRTRPRRPQFADGLQRKGLLP